MCSDVSTREHRVEETAGNIWWDHDMPALNRACIISVHFRQIVKPDPERAFAVEIAG